MNRHFALPVLVSALASCSGPASPPKAPLPPLPPIALAPFQPTLSALAVSVPAPEAGARRELLDLADLALQRVQADTRTAARAERALLEHPHAGFVLEPALLHDDVGTRRRAAWLCGQSGQSVLQLPLLLRLKYELDPEALLWVADALQRLGNDAGLLWLGAAMDQEAQAEQAGAMAVAICRERGLPLAEPPTYAELQQAMRRLDAAWRQTGESTRPGVQPPAEAVVEPRLATHLATTQGTLLRPVDDARYVLTRCGKLALPLLVRALSASEPYLRTMALQVLAELGPVAHETRLHVLPLLGDALTGAYAMRTLGEIGAVEAMPHLRARLATDDTELRAAATQALGLLRDEASVPVLRKLLLDGTEQIDVRVGAAFGLLCLGADPAAAAFLAEREARQDYHEPTLRRLRERLAALGR